MNAGVAPKKPGDCHPPTFAGCRSLREMVDLFLRERHDRPGLEKSWWGDPRVSLQHACRRAMFTFENEDGRDGHQWVFSKADLRVMGELVADHAAELKQASGFNDLYRRVENVLCIGRNRKPLLVYDISRRLGYWLGYEPEEVYLHAGPKAGAEALRRGLGRPRSRPLADFPNSIRTQLSPAQAEDFLCVAARFLRTELWD